MLCMVVVHGWYWMHLICACSLLSIFKARKQVFCFQTIFVCMITLLDACLKSTKYCSELTINCQELNNHGLILNTHLLECGLCLLWIPFRQKLSENRQLIFRVRLYTLLCLVIQEKSNYHNNFYTFYTLYLYIAHWWITNVLMINLLFYV